MLHTSVWHLQLATTTMLHLDEQIQPFLKWIWGLTKAPTKRFNGLTIINLEETTLQNCQELLKAPFLSPKRAWHLYLERVTTLHLDQQVHPFLKWIWRRTKAPTNRIIKLKRYDFMTPNLKTFQEFHKKPCNVPHECLAPAVGKVFHAAPGSKYRSILQGSPGADQIPRQ